jgi:hypothetical protein
MYISRQFKGSVWEITPDAQFSIYAQLPTLENARMSGLAFHKDDLFVTYYSYVPVVPVPPVGEPAYVTTEYNGVWKISKENDVVSTQRIFPLHDEPLTFIIKATPVNP